MRRYFVLAAPGVSAAPQQEALLTEQPGVLQERLQELESHLRYIDDKIAYWQAVVGGDVGGADAPPADDLSPAEDPVITSNEPLPPNRRVHWEGLGGSKFSA
jgi:hypothetical protein